MKKKAIRCLLILSFLTIFGLVFYVDTAYSQETIRNKTKIEKLEDKVENLSQRYEQNKTFYEAVFHQQNVFVRWIIFIFLGILGFQGLFTFKISKDVVDRCVEDAKKDMLDSIEKMEKEFTTKTQTTIETTEVKLLELEGTYKRKIEEISNQVNTLREDTKKEIKENINELTGLICHNAGIYYHNIGDYPYAITRFEAGIRLTKEVKNKQVALYWLTLCHRKLDKTKYPKNFRDRIKQKPELYSGLEKEIEKAIKEETTLK